jgi:hypothetical protein
MEQAVQLQPIKWSEIAGQTASPKTDHHDPDK